MKFLDYIQGLRKGKDAHRIEHDAMSDPFLSDAIDGYDSVEGNHSHRIAEMQSRISGHTASMHRKQGVWKIAVAAVVFIALIGGYFALMNDNSTMVRAGEADNSYITIYAPDSYIERKGIELAELKEAGKNTSGYLNARVDIVNLHEVIKPIEKIDIYMPEVRYARLNEKELRELSPARERATREEALSPATAPDLALAEEASGATLNRAMVADASPAAAAEKMSMPAQTGLIAKNDVDRVIKGKVVDERNEPLIGVTVAMKGTNKGTVTDRDGNYQLSVDSTTDADLIAQYIGYETVEIPKAKDNQVIAMKESQQALDEVVVMGYATQKKSSITGAVSSIKSEKLSKSKPKPVTGDKAYKKYLKDNLVKPDNAACGNGKVIVEFNVNSSGRPVNIKVVKGICEPFDKEALRLIETGPDWTYGTERVKVEVKF